MTNFCFSLRVSGVDPDPEKNYEDPFFEAGCDDALIGSVDGEVFLDFARDASSYDEAVKTAVRDVERMGARVVAVIPITDL